MDRLDREIKELIDKLDTSIADNLSEYHKGEWCPVQGIFCQEGYCSGCDIAKRQKDNFTI